MCAVTEFILVLTHAAGSGCWCLCWPHAFSELHSSIARLRHPAEPFSGGLGLPSSLRAWCGRRRRPALAALSRLVALFVSPLRGRCGRVFSCFVCGRFTRIAKEMYFLLFSSTAVQWVFLSPLLHNSTERNSSA